MSPGSTVFALDGHPRCGAMSRCGARPTDLADNPHHRSFHSVEHAGRSLGSMVHLARRVLCAAADGGAPPRVVSALPVRARRLPLSRAAANPFAVTVYAHCLATYLPVREHEQVVRVVQPAAPLQAAVTMRCRHVARGPPLEAWIGSSTGGTNVSRLVAMLHDAAQHREHGGPSSHSCMPAYECCIFVSPLRTCCDSPASCRHFVRTCVAAVHCAGSWRSSP